ncbi:MAG: 3'-5' exoribonuclease [Caldilineaceae bacterium]|nr:3'-5' exoribonuclease [Caldilineaceae bacterium]
MPERVYIALDLETTGLDAKRDAIIEIGAVRFQGTRILERFVTFVNPQRTIPLRVQQLTQIRNSDVANAPTIDAVIPELLTFVRSDVAALVAHNAAFDMGFLKAAGIELHRPVLDTFELATILLSGVESYSLGELCRAFAVPLVDAHRALADAEATAQLFMHLQHQLQQSPAAALRLIVEHATDSTWAPALLFADALAAVIHGIVPSPVPGAGSNGDDSSASSTNVPIPVTGDGSASATGTPQAVNAPRHTTDDSEIEQFFAADGPLAAQFADHYEVRRGQIDVALQVNRALNVGEHLLLEAGTGIGKSLAYLLPAALWSVPNGCRVLVATNTIALQEQLLKKDIPLLQRMLLRTGQSPPTTTLLKGRQHYLCAHRFDRWHSNRRLPPSELTFLAKILLWLPTTQTGDVEELFLATPRERALWQEICSDPATCTPERCDHLPEEMGTAPLPQRIDFFYRARRLAEDAHLLIVNHALLIADLVTGGRLLPPYNHLIVDEAHRFDEVATEQLTYRADWQWLIPLLERLTVGGTLQTQVETLAIARGQVDVVQLFHEVADETKLLITQLQDFRDRLLTFVKHQRGVRTDVSHAQQLYLDAALRAQPQWSQLEIEWEQLRGWFNGVIHRLGRLLTTVDGYGWRQDERTAICFQDVHATHERLNEALVQLNAIVLQDSTTDAKGTITWAELHDSGETVSLLAAPLYVNEILEQDLVLQQRTAIFTGATLRTGSGFTYIRERLGLWHASALTVDSPFDYEWSTLLCMPTDMPPPDHAYYQGAVERAIIDAAVATGGRTLALFTSYAQLRITADAIRTELDQAGITVLEHGANSRSRLLREYRRLEKAVLLGTRSFWEGVDLPGNELRCLLIVKLPFAVPSDPLVAARCRDLENSFGEYMLPDAILRFRQGFGRLIRRESDRGVVVLLDSRLWRKSYGSAFLESLPRCTASRQALSNLHEEIEQWLREHG